MSGRLHPGAMSGRLMWLMSWTFAFGGFIIITAGCVGAYDRGIRPLCSGVFCPRGLSSDGLMSEGI